MLDQNDCRTLARPLATRQLAAALLASGMITLALAPQARAEAGQISQAGRNFNIAAGPLDQVLNTYAKETGILLVIDGRLTEGRQSRGLNGTYELRPGLDAILAGSGLQAVVQDNGSYKLQKALQLPRATGDATTTLPEVAVSASAERQGELSPEYPGMQVARGGRAGLLGQRDFMDLPFNATNYTSDMIENQQARSIGDLLQSDPSVRQASARTNINEDFSIRGFTVSSQDLAFNGMYGLMPFYRVPVEMAERVEVLKGPSALLNGMPPSGNVGGSINVVPKRAADQPLTRFTASYMSDSIYGGHADLGRRFGENNEFGIRLNGAYRKGDMRIDRQDVEETVGSLALDYRGERLRLSADIMYQQENLGVVVRQFSVGNTLTKMPSAPDNKLNYPGYGYSKMKDSTVVLRGEYDINDQATVYAGFGTRKSRMDALAGNPTLDSADGTFSSAAALQLYDVSSRSAEIGGRFQFSTGAVKHQVSAGVTRVTQNADIHFVGVGLFETNNLYSPVYGDTPDTSGFRGKTLKYTTMELTSYALADTLSFMDDRLQLTLGARHQNVEQQNYVIGTGQKSGEGYDKSAVTPVAGIVFKPVENVALYANYIEGLSQGQVAQPPATNAGQMFSPYKTKQKEAGVKVDWGRVATTLSLFEIERPSAITTGNEYRVSGEQRNRGIELNVFGELNSRVRILGGGAYSQGKLVKTEGGNFNGNTAIGVPDWQVSLGSEWDPVFAQGLTLTARVIHTSKQYVNEANTLSIPSVTRFDIGARYKTTLNDTPVTLRANVENLFDRDFWNTSNEGYIYLGTPRTVLLSATVDF
ncbi:iron complex outermembrane recepter protein [Methylobacillus rhizosphaerae]|uniref:Iron complex outermembrane recepter protein n=2 Tax=Methylobacillus rhizosphaerae TaxID=551994 RepID=A0A238ZA89_9PROT|nr:iron complex outermembrane recepter protein [Methylobacillus rhizosphaerae]